MLGRSSWVAQKNEVKRSRRTSYSLRKTKVIVNAAGASRMPHQPKLHLEEFGWWEHAVTIERHEEIRLAVAQDRLHLISSP